MRSFPPLALLLPMIAQAQFAPPSAVWTYDHDLGTYTVSVVGDTVIDGHTCSEVQGALMSACWESSALLYQEGDEVYFKAPQFMEDFTLLYKWDAQVGESWDIVIPDTYFNTTLTYTVLGTGTAIVNGEQRRSLTVQLNDNDDDNFAYTSGTLIEGIGDLHYLFPWLMPWCDPMFPGPLRCYTDVDGTWMAPGITECQPPASSTVFAPVGAKWTYTQEFIFVPPFDSTLYVIECTGDTVIQGRTCSILERTAGMYSCMGFQRYLTTSGDSVLFWNPLIGGFTPLYIWSAEVGEGWSTLVPDISGTANDTLNWSVTATGSLSVDAVSLRTMDVGLSVQNAEQGWIPFGSGEAIERFGGTGFLFPWIFNACDGDVIGPLRCYEDSGISWLNPGMPQCDLSVGIDEPFATGSSFLQTTAATSGSLLQLQPGIQAGALLILDATGRTVAQAQSTDGTFYAPRTAGTYSIVLLQDGRKLHQRIVVH